MLIGFNNDVSYKGKTYHIQTEDNGIKNATITTILFFQGQTLTKHNRDYRDLLEKYKDPEELKKAIKARMVELHRMVYKNLFDGVYEEKSTTMFKKGRSNQFQPSTPKVETKRLRSIPKSSPQFPHSNTMQLSKLSNADLSGSAKSVPIQKKIPEKAEVFRGIFWDESQWSILELVAIYLEEHYAHHS